MPPEQDLPSHDSAGEGAPGPTATPGSVVEHAGVCLEEQSCDDHMNRSLSHMTRSHGHMTRSHSHMTRSHGHMTRSQI